MIEIDPSIIDAQQLLERVAVTARSKNIPEELYGNAKKVHAPVEGISRIHKEMVSVYQNLQMMNATWMISEKVLYSSRPFAGRFIVLGKRIFRRLTRWLFQSYYQQQTDFNGAVTRAVSDMIKVQENLIRLYEAESDVTNEGRKV